MDMNGDFFPDIITAGGFVQATKPDGTLHSGDHMGVCTPPSFFLDFTLFYGAIFTNVYF
jgi:hypothetical protein